MTNVTATVRYCDLKEFASSYREIHGHLSILVCVFGSIANILNICVLTTKEMRWPTNFILTGLAIADLLVMLEYIPFASHLYLNPKSRMSADYFTYTWAVYMIFHALFTQVLHFISCCLTVILAIWRYIAITHPQNNKLWYIVSNIRSTVISIVLTYLICPLMCVPLFLSLNVIKRTRVMDERNMLVNPKLQHNFTGTLRNGTLYTAELSGDFINVSFWVYSVVIKLVPCVLLTILSMRLISALLETKKRRRNLLNSTGLPLREKKPKKSKRHLEKEHQTDRTTRMLLAVLLLFLITEFPQAILGLLSVVIGKEFVGQCYTPLGDLMDILALVNSAINFILYCSMSRQFRSAFSEVFRPKLLNRWLPLPARTTETNGGMTQVTQV
ncbi:G protein-coupled receptor [Oryctes borbonicus]|uniref:G protein-coupled receptor n=1 Tax=Oryctes borbonicus TaxID=1629725 RepID=A0A0T6BET9_9SCAR|nr:G protein-coupled receptor [Oryctes borbonicus]